MIKTPENNNIALYTQDNRSFLTKQNKTENSKWLPLQLFKKKVIIKNKQKQKSHLVQINLQSCKNILFILREINNDFRMLHPHSISIDISLMG